MPPEKQTPIGAVPAHDPASGQFHAPRQRCPAGADRSDVWRAGHCASRENRLIVGLGSGQPTNSILGTHHVRNHTASIGRMELIFQAKRGELTADGVDTVADDKVRPIVELGDRIAEQPTDGAAHVDAAARAARSGRTRCQCATDRHRCSQSQGAGASSPCHLYKCDSRAGFVRSITRDKGTEGEGCMGSPSKKLEIKTIGRVWANRLGRRSPAFPE